ncbi:MAG: VWA domain-containing protein [Moraxella sp.]|nr:VWA domain-containing protein [Moraxella sp.]
MQLIKGQKSPISAFGLGVEGFDVMVSHRSAVVTDVAIFGLDELGRLSDEAYMTFYNQPKSPCGAVGFDGQKFSIRLSDLNPKIHTLTLAISIDGQGVARDLHGLTVSVVQHGQTMVSFIPTDLADEKAVMLLSFYKKGEWRVNAVGQGFDGGLASLIRHFGGEVADDIPAHPPAQNHTSTLDLKKKLSLQKAEQTGNPSIIDLTKKSLITLEKKGLLDVKARVALVLDASGSMNWQYKNGDVQKVVNRLMPLAINFDDDGSFECWAFANLTTQLDDVTLQNINDFVNTTKHGWKNWAVGARFNNEIPAIKAVIDYYCLAQSQGFFGKLTQSVNPATLTDKTPVYVLFISDGGVGSSRQMQKVLTECANLPIFWQFVGVGGRNYGVLKKLDDMTGRVVDNCNFFEVDSINSISDDRLYELLLEEFPKWLDEAKQKGIIG